MANSGHKKVDETLQAFQLSDEQLHIIKKHLDTEFNKGLGRETNSTAKIKMLPTYVTAFPDGTENGRFMALDLGGSNFRVLLVKFTDGNLNVEAIRKFHIPAEIMTGPGYQLFDYIAEHVNSFTTETSVCEDGTCSNIPLGFTFSFPCIHRGLASAELVTWTKGYDAPGVVGEDVVALLNQAFRRKKVQAKVVALMNDTVATLMAGAAIDPNCKIGVILGTGHNAAYVEQLDKVETFVGQKKNADSIVIDTELGAFGDNGCLEEFRTDFDRDIDRRSFNAGKQLYEKCVAGMYLGEIVRLILINLTEEGVIFEGKLPANLKHEWKLESRFLSEIDSDTCSDDEQYKQVLARHIGVINPSSNDLQIVRQICVAVRTRAARLAGSGIAGVMDRVAQEEVTLAVDGSLFKAYSMFRECFVQTIGTLTDKKFNFILPEDGSGIGAAVIAAVAHHCKDVSRKN